MAKRKNKRGRSKVIGRRYRVTDFLQLFFLLLFLGICVLSINRIPTLEMFKINNIDSDLSVDYGLKKMIIDKTIFRLDAKEIHDYIEDNYSGIKTVQVEKKFPATVNIKVIKRTPFAQFKRDEFYILDAEGVVLSMEKHGPEAGLFIVELGDYNKKIK